MARSRSDLPRMQNQSPHPGAARAGRCAALPQAVEKPAQSRKPPMMRQYELIERVRRYNPNTNEDLLNRAYVYAMKAHGEQKRASGDPYFSHPLEVAAILTDLKLDDATIAAALLHDTIEDTDATRAEIDQLFGHDIGALVEGLTKLKKLDLVSSEAKQAENLRKLLLAIADDVRVLLVKLADRLHNMRTLEHMPAGGAPAHRRGDARHLCAARRPHGHARDARGAGGPGVPRAQSGRLPGRSASGSTRSPRATSDLIAEIEQQLTTQARRPRHRRAGARAGASAPIRSGARWSASRSASSSCPTSSASASIVKTVAGLLPGARHRPHDLAGGAGPLQGLHLDAEAERLPLDPHHGDRARQAARRTADPHRRDARDRRIRHRRARALQGRRRLADRNAVARIERLCLAAPHHRAAGRRLQPGGIPRAHQARAVPRPGVLLHAEGQADRAAAQGDADRFRLCGAHRRRQHARSAARSTARSRRWCPSSRTATRSRSSPRRRRPRRRRPGNRSSSPARRAPRSAARRAPRCARNMPGSAGASSSGCSSAPRATIPTRSSPARCRGWRAPRSRTCWRRSAAAR